MSQLMSDNDLQELTDASPAPRVTEDSIKDRIQKIDYFNPPDTTMTICIITMENGFTFEGISACVDPANFNPIIGNEWAYRKAFDKIWAFEGYLLAERRWQEIQKTEAEARRVAELSRVRLSEITYSNKKVHTMAEHLKHPVDEAGMGMLADGGFIHHHNLIDPGHSNSLYDPNRELVHSHSFSDPGTDHSASRYASVADQQHHFDPTALAMAGLNPTMDTENT
jgi:hypothetical protein